MAEAAGGRAADDGVSVKERILRAAIHEFALTGYHGTPLRTVIERSGSNKPMIYYHFHGKDGLYLAAVRLLLEEMAERLRVTVSPDLSALERLRRFAEVYLDSFLLSRPLLGTVLRELEGLPPAAYHTIEAEYGRLIATQLRRLLEQGVERGEFRAIHIEGCVGGVIALLHGYVHGRHRSPAHAKRIAVSQLMDYYALGLVAHPPAVGHAAVCPPATAHPDPALPRSAHQ